MVNNGNAQQLLDKTLTGLEQDAESMQPQVNDLIDQWVKALGAGDLTLDNVAYELEELKQALKGGRAPQIAGSLHSLSKLTKRAAGETSDSNTADRLRNLAETLDNVSARVAQSR
ncbi:hypothetical protein GCM10023189_03820 [Nibrella saemangeumensis]|uniref:Uncharacterized protein n=1 Tax=Nibrella saemangeumensis TaxID=1084526 RepID=A0ABP8MC30_9BACT